MQNTNEALPTTTCPLTPSSLSHAIISSLLLLCLFYMLNLPALADEIARHPHKKTLSNQPVSLILDTQGKRQFRTILRTAAAKDANFNDHYRLEYWGCGTSCISWAVINLANGKVWMAPQVMAACWPYNNAEQSPKAIPDWFELSVSSDLIQAYECHDDSGLLTYNIKKVYKWKGSAPVLMSTESVAY